MHKEGTSLKQEINSIWKNLRKNSTVFFLRVIALPCLIHVLYKISNQYYKNTCK